jgi:hypothetical protein
MLFMREASLARSGCCNQPKMNEDSVEKFVNSSVMRMKACDDWTGKWMVLSRQNCII